MAKAYSHAGPYQTISSTASPGLRFLKAFLPAVDALTPAADPLAQYLTPNAVFIINGGEPTPAETIISMMKMRGQRLKTFRHDVKAAWDIEMGDGKRVVMYESVSVTVFRDDADEKAVEVAEFSTVELEAVGEGEGGFGGWAAGVLRTFMDASPVVSRMRQIEGSA